MKKTFLACLLTTIISIILLLSGCSSTISLNYDGSGVLSMTYNGSADELNEFKNNLYEKIAYYNKSERVNRLKITKCDIHDSYLEYEIKFKNIRFLDRLSKIFDSVDASFYCDRYDKLVSYNANDILFVKEIGNDEIIESSSILNKEKYKAVIIKNLDVTYFSDVIIKFPNKIKFISYKNVEVIDDYTIRLKSDNKTIGVMDGDNVVSENRDIVESASVIFCANNYTGLYFALIFLTLIIIFTIVFAYLKKKKVIILERVK